MDRLSPELELIAVSRMREWGQVEDEFVQRLPPDEQDMVLELVALLDARPVPSNVIPLRPRPGSRRPRGRSG